MIPIRAFLKLAAGVTFPKRDGYLELPLARKMTIRIYDRPGDWMQDPELHSLAQDLREIYKNALSDRIPEYGALAGDRDDMKRRLICVVRDEDKTPVAFSAQARLPVNFGELSEEVIHLGLVAIDQRMKGRGLQGILYSIPILYIFFASGMNQFYFTNVTQVPAIIGQAEDYLEDVFPSSNPEKKQGYHHYRIAQAVYHQFKDVFGVDDASRLVPDRQIIENSYHGGSDELKKTFAECAKHRRPGVNDFCRDQLDYDRGDDFIQVGRMDYHACFSFLYAHTESLTRCAINRLVTGLLEGVAIPVLRWVAHG